MSDKKYINIEVCIRFSMNKNKEVIAEYTNGDKFIIIDSDGNEDMYFPPEILEEGWKYIDSLLKPCSDLNENSNNHLPSRLMLLI